MARALYTLFLWLIAPLIGLRLVWRARRQPDYLQHLGERLGRYTQPRPEKCLWVHAVSVGETRAAQPLIAALQARWPDHRILLTGMTPTGRAAGQAVYGETVTQVYLPYDYPGAVDRFLRHFSPAFGVLMETEIWPNLLAGAQRRAIPVFLVNARLSARSARGYGRFRPLVGPAFAGWRAVAALTADDAARLRDLGGGNVEVCGNLKFDVAVPPERIELGQAWRQAIGQRPVFLAASTRDGEEALILTAWKAGALPDDALLVIVPRHPQRVALVADEIRRAGLTLKLRSAGLPTADDRVWLGDSMGEMPAYYTLADVAYIGGSLLPLGGQNLIEAAACGCPVMVGPHTFNFRQATEDALAAGAARRVVDAPALLAEVGHLLVDEASRSSMAAAARAFAAAHRGATQRTLLLIEQGVDGQDVVLAEGAGRGLEA